jgi:hypothetical protein
MPEGRRSPVRFGKRQSDASEGTPRSGTLARSRDWASDFAGEEFCYIDAYLEPEPPSRKLLRVLEETRDQYLERVRAVLLHLCRLRYFGALKTWSMAFYTYSNERDEPCPFLNGIFYRTPEQAFEVGAAYLRAR